jgi:hypothetical protein
MIKYVDTNAKNIHVDIDDSDVNEEHNNPDIKSIDINERRTRNTHPTRPCVTGCGRPGHLRLASQNYLCMICRRLPPHRMITMRTIEKEFELTREEVKEGVKHGTITEYAMVNPLKCKYPIQLYYAHEIEQWKHTCKHRTLLLAISGKHQDQQKPYKCIDLDS